MFADTVLDPGHRHARGVLLGLTFSVAGLALVVPLAAHPQTQSDSSEDAREDDGDWEDAWEQAEERARQEERARAVNEGELEFLPDEPEADAARMEKRIDLDGDSLEDGWARMRQCHHNLDPAPAVQIVYNEGRTRDIRITESDRVGEAEVDGSSVQMREIERGASLCVEAEVLAIRPHPDEAGYLVENGPFMRRFLDGYYPMAVRLDVRWPAGMLSLEHSEPPAQPGLSIDEDDRGLSLNAHFEGRLESRLHLVRGSTAR